MNVRRALAPLAVLGVIALAGCSAPAEEPKVEYDYDYIDMGKPAAATEAGTALAFGDVAWLEMPKGNEGDVMTTGITVRDIFEAPEGFMDEAVSNPEEFTEFTPHIIVIQQHLPQDIVDELGGMPSLQLYPMLADGTPGSYVTTLAVAATDSCGNTIPAYEGGEASITCMVGLAAEGEEITGALYNDIDSFTVVLDENNPYQTSPVTWAPKG